MIQQGYAWWYKKYSKKTEYGLLEEAAREEKKGLWIKQNPIEPEKYRRKR
jgi:endonuclease YncB( thermonuclease family)